jgi:diguanylate cyclase (GGDEF)-like protein
MAFIITEVGMAPKTNKPAVEATKGILNLFLVIFLCVGALLAGLISVVYQLQTDGYIDRLKNHETFAVRVEGNIIDDIFEEIISDLKVLSQQPALHSFLTHGQDQFLKIMEQEYLILSRAKKDYDQIRFLGAKGMEVVRVDYNRGNPAVVPKTKLQNKFKRYYFADTFALGRGKVFISPLDLNIERGQIEKPLKPMIRFGMVVFDKNGEKRGIVLLNYLGANLIKRLEQAGEAMYGQPLLINRDGYWLLGPQPDDAWGFMLDNRKNKNLSTQFPLSATTISDKAGGQLINKEGMFSFTTIYPLKRDQQSSTGADKAFAQSDKQISAEQYHWKLVSHINRKELDGYSFDLLFNLSLLGATLFLLTAVASWLIAGSITRKRLHRAELFNMAHFDTLTGLPNRTLYFDRLNQAFESSKRHHRSFAILYVDLDDFKKVNDTMGHSAGDMVLKTVSKRMLDVVRKSDTVGRMGGDEFMIILNDITQPGDAEMVAQKLLLTLTRPVDIGEQQATVGACIGVAIFPNDSEDKDTLIKMADEAMYACKEAGKNNYKTVSSIDIQGEE